MCAPEQQETLPDAAVTDRAAAAAHRPADDCCVIHRVHTDQSGRSLVAFLGRISGKLGGGGASDLVK